MTVQLLERMFHILFLFLFHLNPFLCPLQIVFFDNLLVSAEIKSRLLILSSLYKIALMLVYYHLNLNSINSTIDYEEYSSTVPYRNRFGILFKLFILKVKFPKNLVLIYQVVIMKTLIVAMSITWRIRSFLPQCEIENMIQ